MDLFRLFFQFLIRVSLTTFLMIANLKVSLRCPRDLKSGNRKKDPITVLTLSVITNSGSFGANFEPTQKI